jgi:hypothetical protein
MQGACLLDVALWQPQYAHGSVEQCCAMDQKAQVQQMAQAVLEPVRVGMLQSVGCGWLQFAGESPLPRCNLDPLDWVRSAWADAASAPPQYACESPLPCYSPVSWDQRGDLVLLWSAGDAGLPRHLPHERAGFALALPRQC